MAYEFYVKIKAKKQGAIKGESLREKRKDWMTGIAYFHEIKAPRDVATGHASGKRQHGAVTFSKEWGAASPQLAQALCTNEILETVEFEFIKTNAEGLEYVYQTILLKNASVCGIKYMTGSGAGEGAASAKHTSTHDTHELESVSFSYEYIEVHNKDAKTSYIDNWKDQGG